MNASASQLVAQPAPQPGPQPGRPQPGLPLPAPLPDPPGTPLSQSALYAAALARMGRDTALLRLEDAGQARVIVRRHGPLSVGLVPGGPVWFPDATHAMRDAALANLPALARGQLGLRVFATTPGNARDSATLARLGHLPLITGQYHARLDLTASRARRRAAMAGKWRNRLARAQAAPMDSLLCRFDTARDRWLLEAEARQRRARGYRALPPAFALAVAAAAPDAPLLALARHRGDPVAAMLFLQHGDTATYLIGHTTGTGRRLNAHTLLLWQAACHLADRGVSRLDLGPVETESQPGLARFKLGSGAVPHPMGATHLWTALTAPMGRLLS